MKDLRLAFQRGAPEGLTLTGDVDADWANDLSDRGSISSYVYKLAEGSDKLESVALSSTEAEYIAGAHAAKEAIWLQRLLAELGMPNHDPSVLRMDNQSAIAIAKNPQSYNRTKYTEVRHHYLRSKVEEEELELEHIPTGDRVADPLTKALNKEKHSKFAKEMGVLRPA